MIESCERRVGARRRFGLGLLMLLEAQGFRVSGILYYFDAWDAALRMEQKRELRQE
jgi:hypothetical protein